MPWIPHRSRAEQRQRVAFNRAQKAHDAEMPPEWNDDDDDDEYEGDEESDADLRREFELELKLEAKQDRERYDDGEFRVQKMPKYSV